MPNTRERLIDAGLDLFYQHGFHAVGIDRIIKQVGTTKTTFYNHFESKDELALACIQKRDASWRVKLPAMLLERAGPDPVAQLHEIFNVWREWFDNIHFNGCLFIHACSEFPEPHDPCHMAAKANVDALREMAVRLAADASIADPEEFGRQYILLMEGAIIMEVINRDNRTADTAGNIARVLIDQSLPRRVSA